jgi:hypothetical protein
VKLYREGMTIPLGFAIGWLKGPLITYHKPYKWYWIRLRLWPPRLFIDTWGDL